MWIELALVLLVGGLAVLPALRVAGRARWACLLPLAAGLLAAVYGYLQWNANSSGLLADRSAEPPDHRPIEVSSSGFVSSRTCRACHPRQYATWHRSYHRTMTQVATPESVLGDFHNVRYPLHGSEFHLSRHADRFWVDIRQGDARPGKRERREVVMTTGSHHLQFYWLATGKDRVLDKLPLAYLLSEDRWVPIDSTFLRPPSRHSSLETGQWNSNCIHCHTTHGQPGFRFTREGSLQRSDIEAIDTRVGEFGISCEACHGPAEQHVQVARNPWRRYRLHLGLNDPAHITHPEKVSSPLSSQICGQCHSIALPRSDQDLHSLLVHGFNFRAGDDLHDATHSDRFVVQTSLSEPFLRKTLRDDPDFLDSRFWSDGMVRVVGREYNGLIESPCYTHLDESKGVMSCLSCHQMHPAPADPRSLDEWADDQLKIGMRGDQACTQCHTQLADADQVEQHTHHRFASAGSRCYNCHMPYTTYGLLKAVRSHTISTPSVQESLETGRPNACNHCHVDKTLAWSAEHLEQWYGLSRPSLGREQQQVAASVLWATQGDAGQRALAAWSLGWDAAQQAAGTDWIAPYLATLMRDPYDAVRYIAYHSLRTIPDYQHIRYDYVRPEDVATVPDQLLTRWNEAPGRRAVARDELLIGSDGKLDVDALKRLIDQRNLRPVLLNE